MSKIAVMTDSNSGMTQEQGRAEGITVLPMPVIIDGTTYYEGMDLEESTFYEKQRAGVHISSSQPSPESLTGLWKELLKTHDEVVYIPMTSSLSGSCESAFSFAGEFEGKVTVVNNYRISVTQMQSVRDAKWMAGQGMSAAQIKETLEKEALDATIYISVDTLKYLKQGGRITPAAAAIGSVLNIKPVLTIQGGKLDAVGKARGMKSAFRMMCRNLHRDLETRLKELHEEGSLMLGMAYTCLDEEEKSYWRSELQKEFPGEEIQECPLTFSIGCHTGPGALGIGAFRVHK